MLHTVQIFFMKASSKAELHVTAKGNSLCLSRTSSKTLWCSVLLTVRSDRTASIFLCGLGRSLIPSVAKLKVFLPFWGKSNVIHPSWNGNYNASMNLFMISNAIVIHQRWLSYKNCISHLGGATIDGRPPLTCLIFTEKHVKWSHQCIDLHVWK